MKIGSKYELAGLVYLKKTTLEIVYITCYFW